MLQSCGPIEQLGKQKEVWSDENRCVAQFSSGSAVIASSISGACSDGGDVTTAPTEWPPIREKDAGGPTMAPVEEWSPVREVNARGVTTASAGEWSPVREADAGCLTTASPEEWSPIREADAGAVPAEEWSPIREAVYCGRRQMQADHRHSSADACNNFLMEAEKGCGELGLEARDPKLSSLFVEDVERRVVACDLEAVAAEPPLKRRKLPRLGGDAVVRVTYTNLTRESKKALQLALQDWSRAHFYRDSSNADAVEAGVEEGTEVYSPALTLCPTPNAAPVFAWMDKPARKQEPRDVSLIEARERENEVPLYDRACASVLSSSDSTDRNDGNPAVELQEVSRCFNCGSYSHSLKKCSRPHDATNIRNARSMMLSKKGSFSNTRYYDRSPLGKFDDLKPGLLGIDTRQGLGIAELDPPPWLNRMRELGYPPGYLVGIENDSSGVEIIGEGTESAFGEMSTVDGVPAGGHVQVGETCTKIKSVEYPGINAPIPENADEKLWAPTFPESPRIGEKRSFIQMNQVHDNGYAHDVTSGWMKGITKLSDDPAKYWYERHLRHIGGVDAHPLSSHSFGATSGTWACQRPTPQLPSLFPSPGLLPSPSFLPPHNLSETCPGRSYRHQVWQQGYSQTSYATDRNNKEAWRKAEAALNALKQSGGPLVSPPGTAMSSQQQSESSLSSHGNR